jgi:hypothetical protein
MHHKHPRNIGLDPISLELVLLPLWQQLIDGVPQLVMIYVAVGGDRLPCSVIYCILVSGPEGRTLVLAEHIRSADDLHDFLVLFLARARNSLDSELWRNGDVDAVQQIPQSAGGDRSFIFKSFDLVGIVECLVLLDIGPRSVILIFFTFSLVALFFFFLVVFFFLMVVVLLQLLSFLRVFSCQYRDHNLNGVLPLRNALRGVGLRLWLGWHIPWRKLSSGLAFSTLPGSVVTTSHLKFGNRRE